MTPSQGSGQGPDSKEIVQVKWRTRRRFSISSVQSRLSRCWWGVFLLILLTLVISPTSQVPLTDTDKVPDLSQVSYYEPVFYDPSHLLASHQRVRAKRSTEGERGKLTFTLSTKSRDFHLQLEEDEDLFHPELEVENSEGAVKEVQRPQVYKGHLLDQGPSGSSVHGTVTPEGHFEGVISLPEEGTTFHVEAASKYGGSAGLQSPGVIYSEDAVSFPNSEGKTCASEQLRDAQESLPKPQDSEPERLQNLSSVGSGKIRRKRYILDPARTTCLLYLQADHLLFNHLGSESKVIDLMARHIQRVNEIYQATDFDGNGRPDGISFMIKRIKVHTNASSSPYQGTFPVIKFLEKFSEGDYESFCLAYLFTFRDFEGGTLGLAWTGDLKNAGGVCERKGHFRGGLKSLNTGILTLLNYGKVVLPAVSYVTMAHEIGHNFGSPHDPENDPSCVPGGKEGNYIMYARATAGDQRNNQRFSPCSLRSIMPVLNSKARHVHGCFTQRKAALCGNREVEEGEECDCGWEEDCRESCCWPMRTNYPKGEIPCTLKPGTECSPSQGPCCTRDCLLRTGNKCREDNGCSLSSYCDGGAAPCPPSIHKPNKTVCLEGQNVCFMGECTGSICLAYGLESCQCSERGKECELCCKLPGEGTECRSSFEWNSLPYDVPDLYAKPGSPCNNYTGYCDSYRTCREVDPSGPLATLRNLLLADEGLSAIAEWVDRHWYAVVSLLALLLAMLILTAKLCGGAAKKRLRKITVLHSNVDAIQVQRSYWDEGGEHVVHPTAIRKKIPLRKKIRDGKRARRGGSGEGGGPSSPSAGAGSKGPRYGTLWRKRGKRGKLPTPQENNNSIKTEGVEQVDLVQLSPETSANASSSSSSNNGGSSAAPGPSSGQPGGSGSGGVVNQHQAKTAILPSPEKKGREKRQRSASSSQQGRSGGSKSRSKGSSSRPSGSGGHASSAGRRGSGSSHAHNPRKKDASKEKEKGPKKTLQIVYTPPFSLKMVHVELAEDSKTNKEPTPTPSPSAPPPTTPIYERELPPIPEQVDESLPPYTERPEPKEAASACSASGSSSKLKGAKKGSSSGVKKSGSFLQRKGRRGKGELRVLIPPPNSKGAEDGELETPTPGS